MTIGGRPFEHGAGTTEARFTTCELAWSVATGDVAALPLLLRDLHPAVFGYCRARARSANETVACADALALEVCRTILADLSGPSGADRPFLRLAYTVAVDSADARFALPAAGALTRVQQDVLILRTIVGLDPQQTSVAMAIAPDRVRAEQHAALMTLRAA